MTFLKPIQSLPLARGGKIIAKVALYSAPEARIQATDGAASSQNSEMLSFQAVRKEITKLRNAFGAPSLYLRGKGIGRIVWMVLRFYRIVTVMC